MHLISGYALSDRMDLFTGFWINPEAGHRLTPVAKAMSHCGEHCVWPRGVCGGLLVFLLSPLDAVSQFGMPPASFREERGACASVNVNRGLHRSGLCFGALSLHSYW